MGRGRPGPTSGMCEDSRTAEAPFAGWTCVREPSLVEEALMVIAIGGALSAAILRRSRTTRRRGRSVSKCSRSQLMNAGMDLALASGRCRASPQNVHQSHARIPGSRETSRYSTRHLPSLSCSCRMRSTAFSGTMVSASTKQSTRPEQAAAPALRAAAHVPPTHGTSRTPAPSANLLDDVGSCVVTPVVCDDDVERRIREPETVPRDACRREPRSRESLRACRRSAPPRFAPG